MINGMTVADIFGDLLVEAKAKPVLVGGVMPSLVDLRVVEAGQQMGTEAPPSLSDSLPRGDEEPLGDKPVRRAGEVMLRDAQAKWLQSQPVYLIIEVTGDGDESYRAWGTMDEMGAYIDATVKESPKAKFRLVGLGSDQEWADSQGDSVLTNQDE